MRRIYFTFFTMAFLYMMGSVAWATPSVPSAMSFLNVEDTSTNPATDANGIFSVNWGASTGVVKYYHLEERLNDGDWVGVYFNANNFRNNFSRTVDGVYEYRVKACQEWYDCSGWSTVQSVNVNIVPSVPGVISFSNVEGISTNPVDDTNFMFSVNWGASTGVVTYYHLEERLDGGNWVGVYFNANNFRNNFLRTVNGVYSYRVKACEKWNKCSDWSDEKSISSIGQEPNHFIRASKNVCTIPEGDSNCSVVVEWEGQELQNTRAPFCVFVKSSTERIGCSDTGDRINFAGVTLGNTVLELRAGNSDYTQSEYLAHTNVIGLDSSANTNVEQNLPIKTDYLKKFNNVYSTSTWDGKVFFEFKIFSIDFALNRIVDKNALTANVLRHKNLKYDNDGKVNFGYVQNDGDGYADVAGDGHGYISDDEFFDVSKDKRIFSDSYLIDGLAALTSEETTYIDTKSLRTGQTKTVKNYTTSAIKDHQIDFNASVNLAVFPSPSIRANPYPSNINGAPAEGTNYVTYRFYAITASDEIAGQQSPIPPVGPTRYILGKFEAQIVVENPDTNHAKIVNAEIIQAAKPLTDIAGNYLHGYEMGVSLDGKMIIYSGNSDPSTIAGRGGSVMYSYQLNGNAHASGGWSVPKNLAAMYNTDGPGNAAGETLAGGVPFSKLFPIAAAPIRDYDNNVFDENDTITGSYVWFSFDASEAMFSSVPGYYGAARHGTILVGARTGGILYHPDGDMNLTRGNPTPVYSNFNGTPEYKIIGEAYKLLAAPNFSGDELGPRGSAEQVMFAPLGLYGSSWNPFKEEIDPVLPLTPEEHSYGFIITNSGRYAEIPLLDNYEDLVLYYPMNEPVFFDREKINNTLNLIKNGNCVGTLCSEDARKENVRFIASETADYSSFLHKGVLNAGAKYPYEHYNVQDTWSSQGVLKDIQEGRMGNSIFFDSTGSVQSTITAPAYAQIKEAEEFTLSFWVKKSALSTGPAFTLSGLITVWLNNTIIDLRLFNADNPQQGKRVKFTGGSQVEEWKHYAISYKLGLIKSYVDGKLIGEELVPGKLRPVSDFSAGVNLTLGPNGSLSAGQMQMDEVYIHSAALDASEIAKLALKKVVRLEHSKISTSAIYDGLPQEFVSLPEDKDVAIQGLGKALFNSTELSLNKSVSCASCHNPANAFSDSVAVSQGAFGETNRNSPPLLNLLFSDNFLWDGRAGSLEEQVLHPIIDPLEMGFDSYPEDVIARLNNNQGFEQLFQEAFGGAPTLINLSKSLARYVRGISSENSNFDNKTMTLSELRGKELFFGHANCVACHSGPSFTDGKFHKTGIDLTDLDIGRAKITHRLSDVGAFKTPTLRNIDLTGPYFHDGRFGTLDEVIEHYNDGGNESSVQSSHIRPLGLSSSDMQDLVNFLKALTGDVVEH